MANLKISGMTAGTAPTGAELVPVVQGGNSRSLTTAQIAGIASNITGTDYDIGTGNETADISTLTATVGSSARYSWYDGDGTYTFSFTGTAGITIDGIASSEYVGEGVGNLDLFVVSASACVTINRGEIWDSDGGGFTYTWEKSLNNKLYQYGTMAGSGDDNTITFDITAAAVKSATSQTQGSSGSGTIINRIQLIDTLTTSSMRCRSIRTDTGTLAGTFTGNIVWSMIGQWTISYPRISA